MPIELLRPDGECVRHKVIREIIQELIREFPTEMREVAAYMKLHTAQQINPKTGAWRNEADVSGHFKVSYPQIFMDVLRPIMREILPEEPLFAESDEDLFYVMQIFPDLIGGKLLEEPKKKPDHRKRTQLWSSKNEQS